MQKRSNGRVAAIRYFLAGLNFTKQTNILINATGNFLLALKHYSLDPSNVSKSNALTVELATMELMIEALKLSSRHIDFNSEKIKDQILTSLNEKKGGS